MTWRPQELTLEPMAERHQAGVRLLRARQVFHAEIARPLGVSAAAVSHWQKVLATLGA